MDISLYFDPIHIDNFKYLNRSSRKSFGDVIRKYVPDSYFPDLRDVHMAIIGVGEERGQIGNPGCSQGVDMIRDYFYDLFPGHYQAQVADLGNIKPGHTVQDTYFALTAVCAELLNKKIVPV